MNKYMKVAFDEAVLAKEESEVPVGAAIFMNEELIASAHNLCETLKDPTAHAEMLAMKKALKALGTKNLSGCDLYVTLEPCAMCTGAAHLNKVKRIYFGAYDAKSGVCGGNTDLPRTGCFDYNTEIFGGIAEPECENLLKDFFKSIRKE